MTVKPQDEDEPAQAGNGERYRVDARGAKGLLVGDQGTQVNYFYKGTWTDGVSPSPLVGMSGEIDSPYRGLGAFGERDAALFFGRGLAADELLERMSRCLAGTGLVVVWGVGSGEVLADPGGSAAPTAGSRAAGRAGGIVVALPCVHPGESAPGGAGCADGEGDGDDSFCRAAGAGG